VTTLLLVRHAMCDPVGKSLAGRAPGVHLNAEGCAQAARLADRLSDVPIAAIYSSPLERARETADAVAERVGVAVQTDDGLTELDYGEWTGRSFTDLESGPHADHWRRFNVSRSSTLVPGGESMIEAQARVVATLVAIAERHRGDVVAAVSHGDVIRAAFAYFAGMPIDSLQRLEVSPASVSVVALDRDGVRIIRLNETGGAVHL